MALASGQGQVPKMDGPIIDTLEDLKACINGNQEIVTMLYDRLGPALRPAEPERDEKRTSDIASATEPRSELVHRIRELITSVHKTNSRMHELLERLET